MIEITRMIEGRKYTAIVYDDELITPTEVSRVIGIGLRHTYRLMDDKKLEVTYFGKKRRIACKEALRYRNAKKV